MISLFLFVLNMSITASYIALAVILARFLLKRAPKIFSYLLWSAVAIRLLIPISFTSNFSILRLVQPKSATDATSNTAGNYMQFIYADTSTLPNSLVDVGVKPIQSFFNPSASTATSLTTTDIWQLILWIGSIAWIVGVAALLLYSAISYFKVWNSVRTATLIKNNVFESEHISAPFVCGFWKPKIYVPLGMSEHEHDYILLHEQTHIRRRDYLIKPLAFILVIINWFNPLMWLSYTLMSKDMEMSCDEHVIKKLGPHIKENYSTSLLALATNPKMITTGSPLAFGESHVKARIKNILTYRQPSSWMVVGYIIVIASLVIGCTANPKPVPPSGEQSSESTYLGYQLEQLIDNQTLYVGNNSKVSGLISGMPAPAAYKVNMLELQTKDHPYGIIIHYTLKDANNTTTDMAENVEVLHRNATLLLSLIDNVDYITASIDEEVDQDNITVSRDQMNTILGEDVRQYATDTKTIKQLIDRLHNLNVSELAGTAPLH